MSSIIPELSELLKGSAQNTILVFLYSVGFIVRHLPDKTIPNNYIPSVVCIASFLITPFYGYRGGDYLTYSAFYAVVAIIGYEAVGRRLEGWIAKKVKALFGDEPEVQPKPFKEDVVKKPE